MVDCFDRTLQGRQCQEMYDEVCGSFCGVWSTYMHVEIDEAMSNILCLYIHVWHSLRCIPGREMEFSTARCSSWSRVHETMITCAVWVSHPVPNE